MDILSISLIVLVILALILWAWAIFDLKKSKTENNNKMFWLIILFCVPLVGTIIYFQMKRRF
jgi:hypothetical protein